VILEAIGTIVLKSTLQENMVKLNNLTEMLLKIMKLQMRDMMEPTIIGKLEGWALRTRLFFWMQRISLTKVHWRKMTKKKKMINF
jgi:hypothetical protein